MFIAHVLPLAESVPKDEDVVAGWLGFFVLFGLIIATALLLWNFTRQIKKAKAANDAGVYGSDQDDTPES
ncbi:hypothetical protein [Nocardioides cavernaquae]|uniref:Uncharacterized protein n=1 Tax=Nocardioides cavernaquae TaxID=2321396 RepID=A0A3A5H794_9ACTN|nr:hypothetical protein [Nocardioides cavernaquae]RJS45275.1 hypothetical protein D4739_02935 [Nocardioides cavernaquae]